MINGSAAFGFSQTAHLSSAQEDHFGAWTARIPDTVGEIREEERDHEANTPVGAGRAGCRQSAGWHIRWNTLGNRTASCVLKLRSPLHERQRQ